MQMIYHAVRALPILARDGDRPASRAALLMPEAVPLLSSGAASKAVVVSGATLNVMPRLTTTRPGRKPVQ
jgi:hypothetical protein